MKEAIRLASDANALAFTLLGLVIAGQWSRRRVPHLGFLALAIVLLAAVVLVGRIQVWTGYRAEWLAGVTTAGFIGSGYALFRFRMAFLPVGRRVHAAIAAGLVTLAVLTFSSGVVHAPRALTIAAALLLIGAWSGLVGESIVRFYLASRRLPAVQRARLRALAFGFGGLVLLILIAIAASSFSRAPAYQLSVQLFALAIAPLLYVSFSPPAWLRRQWRAREEQALAEATQGLLRATVDRAEVAVECIAWAERLVGASAGLVLDASGAVLAGDGLDAAAQATLAREFWPPADRVTFGVAAGRGGTVLTLPLDTGSGWGEMILVAGPFSPAFGSDELARVRQYAGAVAATFERIDLVDRLERTNDELRMADRHKSIFLANMSHELRTPLNSILGFSELMIDADPARYDPDTSRRFLEQIHSSGQHLLTLINDILDLSKVEAGQMELRPVRVRVAELVGAVLSTVEPLAAQKQIEIAHEVPVDLAVTADSVKLRQMLLNLLSNAIKFTPAGGRVAVVARARPGAVEISVTDTGIGIADADQERIFEQFQQVDEGVARRQEGTGLGLTLTRRFAEMHGGTVTLTSEPGAGSTFTIVLPDSGEPAAETAPGEEPAEAAEGPLVLVVEDHPAAAELLRHQLAEAGFRTALVASGERVLEAARAQRPAAITLDILLPGIDGWEVLASLKQDEATRDIPVVVVSVVDNPDLGRALGAVEYLVKPIDRGALLQALDRYLTPADRRCVLIVDDEPANRQVLTELLEPLGYTVLTAAGGREGIEMVRAHRPGLVLLDLMMPDVSGFDVVEELRRHPTTSAVPIIAITAKNLSEAEKKQLSGGVTAVLSRDLGDGTGVVAWVQKLVAPRGTLV